MKKSSLLLVSLIVSLLSFYACSQNNDEGVVVQGIVLNQVDNSPIVNALVQISSPAEFSDVFTRSDSTGKYSIGEIEISEVTDLSISVSAPNFETVDKSVKVAPEDKVNNFDFVLTSSQSDDNGGGTPSAPTGGATSIELIELTNETINIAATGGNTTSKFTFAVKDSTDNNIDLNNSVDVTFSILSGPGGGETITPVNAATDANGLVSATLKSGNIAGVVQIEARIERTVPETNGIQLSKSTSTEPLNIEKRSILNKQPGLELKAKRNNTELSTSKQKSSQTASNSTQQNADIIITSQPVAVTIHGGFPDQNEFHISSEQFNYEFVKSLQVPVSVTVGDEFRNPVKPGTAVYFSVSPDGSGVIEGSAQGHTDEQGLATVNLTPKVTGDLTVTATTVDKNNVEISSPTNLLFTSSKALINAPEQINLDSGSDADIAIDVTDLNGAPMAPGTSIEISTESEGISISGATNTELSDETTTGDGITSFDIKVSSDESFSGNGNLLISVTSPSGQNTSKPVIITSETGTVPGDPEEAASMQLISLSEETINIAESGGTTNTAFTFQVFDAAGRPLDSQSSVDVNFTITSNPGGATITPATATTDAQGRVTSNLNAGNTAGVVQIQAEVAGTTITSKPVAVTIHGGFPDQAHFTLEPITDTNIEGFDRNGVEINFKVRAGDEFSNPVKPGTAVYFETSGGVIEGSGVGHTDETGYTEVTLFAGNPRPTDGKGVVTAKTTDANGVEISETSDFIFSTSKANISLGVNELQLAPNESQSVSYSVEDLNGNPMAAGTTIEVIAENAIELTGTTSHTMSNELAPGTNITDFNFTAKAPEDFEGSETISIIVTSPSGSVTTNQELTVLSTGSGVTGPPAEPAFLVLENVQHDAINIKETGGIVNSAITFQVQDASGRALNQENPVDVSFDIVRGPDGGEGMSPVTVTTNAQGRVTSNLFSGNLAGTVMIEASITLADASVIRSAPVAVAIHGGFPADNNFTVTAGQKNFESFDLSGVENTINVLVGDKFSNPVKPGTAVYFSTDSGVIEGSGVGHTDELGRASVILQSGNPYPADGIATITAQTIDENGDYITKTVDVVMSSSTAQISTTPTTFALANEGDQLFDVTITDINGNPMAPGTTIAIEAMADGIELSGNDEVTLGDHTSTGVGITDFQFIINDTDTVDEEDQMFVKITVTTPSGTVTEHLVSGTRRKAPN